MRTLQKVLTALVVVAAAVAQAPPAAAQSATAGRRAAVTTRLGAPDPSAAMRLRSVPAAHPRARRAGIADHLGRAGSARGFVGTTQIFVPYATTYRGGSRDAAVVAALEQATQAALEAREAALDAREAALDVRDAVSTRSDFITSGAHTDRPAPGAKVLTWKPGGITPVPQGEDPGSPSRTVFLDPAAKQPPAPDAVPATRVRLVVSPIPLVERDVPWWMTDGCPALSQVRQQRPPDRRAPWGLGWLYRYGRDVEVERGTIAPPSFYMRSPLLSGLYRRGDCPPADGAAESCAEVTLVGDDDAEIAFEVPLPQLEAATAPALRDRIRADLADGETVVLRTTDGEDFDLMAGSVREIGTGMCRLD